MTTRYDAYYKSIPSLGRDRDHDGAGSNETVNPVRAKRLAPPAVVRQASVLEAQRPDIVQAITLLWGYPEMNTYFEKLWLDDGTEMRRPLTPEAMSELMLLAGVHQWLAPHRPARNMASIYDASYASARRRDIWDDVPRRR
jgi:hypothetical protein